MDPVLHRLRLHRAPLLRCHTHRHKKTRQEQSHKSCNRQGEIWVKFEKSVWPGPSISSRSSPVICIFRHSLYYCLPDLIISYEHAIWYFILFHSESHLITKQKLQTLKSYVGNGNTFKRLIGGLTNNLTKTTNIVFVLFSMYPLGMQDETNCAFFCLQEIDKKGLVLWNPLESRQFPSFSKRHLASSCALVLVAPTWLYCLWVHIVERVVAMIHTSGISMWLPRLISCVRTLDGDTSRS